MLRIDRKEKSLKRLDQPAMPEAGLTERYDIQQMIRNSPEAFFKEMGETLLLIGEETRPTEFVDDRIDLLAIDQEGAVVVIELKRGSHKLHLLQALSYASMVSKWDREAVITERAKLTGKTPEDAEEDIEQFLLEGIGELNKTQRVLLLAENFDYQVLITAEWLGEEYEVDVRCYRLGLSEDEGAEFLSCTCIYPPPELSQVAIRRRARRGSRRGAWPDWDTALNALENPIIEDFFRSELADGRDSYLPRRVLYYKIGVGFRFNVAARKKAAYVWQTRRFRGDENFWKRKIGPQAEVKPVKRGRAMRFFLASKEDFTNFLDAVRKDLPKAEVLDSYEASDVDSEE